MYTFSVGCGARVTEEDEPYFTDPNNPPSISILGPQTLNSGQMGTYILQTSDPDGDPTFASLSVNEGQLSAISEKEYSYFAPLVPGTYILTATVSDSRWATATSTMNVAVQSSESNIDISISGLQSSILAENELNLTIVVNTDSLTDLTFSWGASGGAFKLTGGTEYYSTVTTTDKAITWKAPATAGLHTITLVATSKSGVKRTISENVQVASTGGITEIYPINPQEQTNIGGKDLWYDVEDFNPLTFEWYGGDDPGGATTTYDLYLAVASPPQTLVMIRSNISSSDKSVTITRDSNTGRDTVSGFKLEYLKKYRWQVVAKSENGQTSKSRVFMFKSGADPLNTIYVDNTETSFDTSQPEGHSENPYVDIQSALNNSRLLSATDTANLIYILGSASSPYYITTTLSNPKYPKDISIVSSSRGQIIVTNYNQNYSLASFTTDMSITLKDLACYSFSLDDSYPAFRLSGPGKYYLDGIQIEQPSDFGGIGLRYVGALSPQAGYLSIFNGSSFSSCNTGLVISGMSGANNQVNINDSSFNANSTAIYALTGSSTLNFNKSSAINGNIGIVITQGSTFNIGGTTTTPSTFIKDNNVDGILFQDTGSNRLNFATANFDFVEISKNGDTDSDSPTNRSLNTGNGLSFEGPSYSPATLTFEGCKISENKQNGIYINNGTNLSLSMKGVRNEVSKENTIHDNEWSGIVINSENLIPIHVELYKNRIVDNKYNGLLASNALFVGSSRWVHNTIANNASWGFNLNGVKNVTMEDNIICANTKGGIVENYYLIKNEVNGLNLNQGIVQASDVTYLSLKYNVIYPDKDAAKPAFTDFNPDIQPVGGANRYGSATLLKSIGSLNASTTINLTSTFVNFNIASAPKFNATTVDGGRKYNLGDDADNSIKESDFTGAFGPGLPAGFGTNPRPYTSKKELGAHGDNPADD
ncbi:right-handed parallel beta-helix repeat-containing protein [Candidatus Riflebacteria bacterium]